MNTKLYRSKTDRMLGGVCGGIAELYGWDVTLVRIITLVIGLTTQVGWIAYIIMWIVIPEKVDHYPNPYQQPNVQDYGPQNPGQPPYGQNPGQQYPNQGQ